MGNLSLNEQLQKHKQILKHKVRELVSSTKLRKLDKLPVPYSPNEIRLFIIARNESLRLHYFFKYYFDKGVDRIFLIDNNSTDDTVSIALSQKNVHVFQTKETYHNHWNWMEILLDKYGKGHWCVVVDADEILYYPHAEKLSLKRLCSFLEAEGSSALHCFLLDMYPKGPLRLNSYKKGENPLSTCSYFDLGYRKCKGFYTNHRTFQTFESEDVLGGVRERIFGLSGTNLSKVPLFKYDPKTYLTQGMHAIDGARISPLSGIVLHFKYLHDFNSKAVDEARREEHWGDASEYKTYAKKIKANKDLTLYSKKSRKFLSTRQLVKLKIMKSSDQLDNFVEEK